LIVETGRSFSSFQTRYARQQQRRQLSRQDNLVFLAKVVLKKLASSWRLRIVWFNPNFNFAKHPNVSREWAGKEEM